MTLLFSCMGTGAVKGVWGMPFPLFILGPIMPLEAQSSVLLLVTKFLAVRIQIHYVKAYYVAHWQFQASLPRQGEYKVEWHMNNHMHTVCI